MMTRRYKSGSDRTQAILFPACVDDYVSQDNPVRAIDAYVDTLDLQALGFQHSGYFSGKGQPPYAPSDLLKLYLYGYMNHVRSSRKLERETHRNIEVMWLIGELHPSYKTIADFRKDNPKALKRVNRDFVLLCRELGLYGGETVAIDGSFFRGNASKASIRSEKTLKKQLATLEAQIEAYQHALESNDQQESKPHVTSPHEEENLTDKLAQLEARQAEKQQQLTQLEASEDTQISTTDPDARLLSKSGQRVAGYNVQNVVDAKHHLIVTSEVTQDGNDSQQLYPMAAKAKAVLEVDELEAQADAGYYEGEQLKQCEEDNITAYVPEPNKNKAIKKQGRYTREAFSYEADKDVYRCPNDEELKPSGQKPQKKNGKHRFRYASRASVCNSCPLRDQCLPEKGKIRQLYRWEHEDVLERHRERMAQANDVMKQRASLVEHPFGTLKDRAGWACHFLVRGLTKVQGEWSIMALGYNFTRVLNILGFEAFRNYCAQRQQKMADQAIESHVCCQFDHYLIKLAFFLPEKLCKALRKEKGSYSETQRFLPRFLCFY